MLSMDLNRRESLLQGGAALNGAVVLSGCADTLRGDSVDVASKQWSEARLLGYMGHEILSSNTDIDVSDEIGCNRYNPIQLAPMKRYDDD